MSTLTLRRAAGAFLAGFLISATGAAFADAVKPEAITVSAQRHQWVDSALTTAQQDRSDVLLSNVNAGN